VASLVDAVSVQDAPNGVAINPSGSNRALIAFLSDDGTTDLNASLTFKGTENFSPVAETGGVTGQYLAAYILLNPSTGSGTVVSSAGSGASVLIVFALEDVDQSTPYDTPVVVEATTGTTASSGAIASDTGDMVVSGLSANGNVPDASMALTGGTREEAIDAGTAHSGAAGWTAGSGGNVTHTWGTFPGNRRTSVIAFNVNGTGGGASPPSITDVDEDDTISADQTNVEVDGANFDAATVTIEQGAVSIEQSIDSQDADTITFDVVFDPGTPGNGPHLKHGMATLRVTNGDAQDDTISITITPAAGTDYVDVGTVNEDSDRCITAIEPLEPGDQLQWGNVQGGDETDVVINDDATFDTSEGVTAFDVRAWDVVTEEWGEWATQTVVAEELEPPVLLANIPNLAAAFDSGEHEYDLSVYFSGATSYAISPAVEDGWDFNTSTGLLTIDTDDEDTFGPFTVTASNDDGETPSNEFTVRVSAWDAVSYYGGTAYSDLGVMGATFLDDETPVPAGAFIRQGFAHDETGRRYVALWPDNDAVTYHAGIARRHDGAMVIAATGTVASRIQGLSLTARGEVIAAVDTPDFIHNGWPVAASGELCLSEVA
jgi:hypothetical protein